MVIKGIDVTFNIADIPQLSRKRKQNWELVDFRDRVRSLLDAALMQAGVGEWTGSKIADDYINLDFDVSHYGDAEKTIRDAIRRTEFDLPVQIHRNKFNVDLFLEAA